MCRSLAASCTSRMPLSVFTPSRYWPLRRMFSTVRPCAMPRGRAFCGVASACPMVKPPVAAMAATAPAPFKTFLRSMTVAPSAPSFHLFACGEIYQTLAVTERRHVCLKAREHDPSHDAPVHRYRDERLPKGPRFASESLEADTR